MKITQVSIKLTGNNSMVLAFVSIVLDDVFVIKDLKIINGNDGMFVAMPSKKATFHCPQCRTKCAILTKYCSECGNRLPEIRLPRNANDRVKLYNDVVHPLNSTTRQYIEDEVIDHYLKELELAKLPGYQCRYDDFQ